MRKNSIKILLFSIIFSICVIGSIFYFYTSNPKKNWVIMSGNEGGKYHEVAKALSKILFQKGLKIEVKTSSRKS